MILLQLVRGSLLSSLSKKPLKNYGRRGWEYKLRTGHLETKMDAEICKQAGQSQFVMKRDFILSVSLLSFKNLHHRPTQPSIHCWGLFKGWASPIFLPSFPQLKNSLGFDQRFGEKLPAFLNPLCLKQETAWVFSGNEISQICFIFALPFLSKIHRRTLWTSVAMIFAAFGLFLCAGPFFAKVGLHL